MQTLLFQTTQGKMGNSMPAFEHLDIDASLGELTLHACCIDSGMPGRVVREVFEDRPYLPGVVLMDEGNLVGVISRTHFLKQLGRPYGVELFLPRPIEAMDLQDPEDLLVMSLDDSITHAARKAVERGMEFMHEPLVVRAGERDYRLLDAQDLMLAQARIHQLTIALYRETNQKLQKTTADLRMTQEKLVQSAHQAGMTELAAEILHNVGNALNSMNTSSIVLLESLGRVRMDVFERIVAQVDPGRDVGTSEVSLSAEQLYQAVRRLFENINRHHRAAFEEAENLLNQQELINRIIKSQDVHVKVGVIPEWVDLSVLIPRLIQSLAETFPGLGVRVEINQEKRVVWAPKPRLTQVLRHILHNAYEAMANQNGDKLLRLNVREAAGETMIEVADSGAGISADNMPRIYSYDFSTKGKGRGFGLHYCANALREMSGAIDLCSEGVGRGTTVTLRLPVKKD